MSQAACLGCDAFSALGLHLSRDIGPPFSTFSFSEVQYRQHVYFFPATIRDTREQSEDNADSENPEQHNRAIKSIMTCPAQTRALFLACLVRWIQA